MTLALALSNAARDLAPDKKLAQADVAVIDRAAAELSALWAARKPAEGQPASSGPQTTVTPQTASTGVLRVSPRGMALIQEFEGLHRLRSDGMIEAYPDPASGGDPWTIGVGTTGPDVKRGTVWTRQQALDRFASEVENKYAAGVRRLLGSAPTTQGQFDALVSFAYNVGLDEDEDTKAEGLGDSSLLRKHKAGDHAGAALEFAKWVNANGRRMNGLVRRRAAEAELYRGRA